MTDDTVISLNWDSFHDHVSKCKKCQKICLDIWDHIHLFKDYQRCRITK